MFKYLIDPRLAIEHAESYRDKSDESVSYKQDTTVSEEPPLYI
jgi:hypothetical protein